MITTNDALFKAFSAKTGQIDPATKEVLHYREALWNAFNSLKERGLLTANCFIKQCRTSRKIRQVSGIPRYEDSQSSNGQDYLYTTGGGKPVTGPAQKPGNLHS
ncbi:MAG: hypothetical protein JXL67_06860 [Calditrichaeota bacterium]|nr:hypothetical protein [Calditrichota bacterium]